MMDVKKLRELAEAATPLADREKRWFTEDDSVYWQALVGGEPSTVPQTFVAASIARPGALRFIAAANPQKVIELLDELAAMTNARDQACDIAFASLHSNNTQLTPLGRVADMRIAELRKVGAK